MAEVVYNIVYVLHRVFTFISTGRHAFSQIRDNTRFRDQMCFLDTLPANSNQAET